MPDEKKIALPPWAQIVSQVALSTISAAQVMGLLSDGDLGKWVVIVATSTQSVLGIHGLYTPVPQPKTRK